MTVESAHQFQTQLQDEFGINYSRLGCLMLDIESIDVRKLAPGIEKDLYYSDHPDRTWLSGDVASSGSHLTLRYGFLTSAHKLRPTIEMLLAGIVPTKISLEAVEIFEPSFSDEKYSCIVARVRTTERLLLAHDRLGYLPHVNTFPDYKPHLTLAYVRQSAATRWAQILQENLPEVLKVTGLDYGREK